MATTCIDCGQSIKHGLLCDDCQDKRAQAHSMPLWFERNF